MYTSLNVNGWELYQKDILKRGLHILLLHAIHAIDHQVSQKPALCLNVKLATVKEAL